LDNNSFVFDLTVKGKITDAATGQAIAGANISIKGSGVNAVSDANGAFSILAPNENAVLVISYTGYGTRELKAGKGENLTIALQSSVTELNQVVVVGYGTQNKKTLPVPLKA